MPTSTANGGPPPTGVGDDHGNRSTATATAAARPTPSSLVDVAHGDADRPFAPLPPADRASAVVTPSGVVLPVIDTRTVDRLPNGGPIDEWVVATPCADVTIVSGLTELGRAHVVLDPGHGGFEVGATGDHDLREKDLNLAVALATARLLESRGATVVLTRTTDITMMTSVRALIARAVRPALFVSIHHNGGAPANGDRPGSIVFTKGGDPEATRFGGLLHQELTAALEPIGHDRKAAFERYRQAFVEHERSVLDHDRSVAAREAALVANGQLDPTVTTLPASDIPVVDGTETPSIRQPVTTTTGPAPAGMATVPVPATTPIPVAPAEITAGPVPEFRWAGTGYGGVRAWLADDGRDLLSVLRRSGDVTAVLAELVYVTNPVEADLLADPAFVELEAAVLADSIERFLASEETGSGFVEDQVGDQDIGGGGHRNTCVDPDLGL
ncbi:MAG: N-acetylmuramoyl-L-alanine amidase [Acidimicrobiales bacterium]